MGSERLVNAEELAGHLGVPVHWVRERSRISREELPVVRVGKYVRFRIGAVLNHLDGPSGADPDPAGETTERCKVS